MKQQPDLSHSWGKEISIDTETFPLSGPFGEFPIHERWTGKWICGHCRRATTSPAALIHGKCDVRIKAHQAKFDTPTYWLKAGWRGTWDEVDAATFKKQAGVCWHTGDVRWEGFNAEGVICAYPWTPSAGDKGVYDSTKDPTLKEAA